MNYTERLDENYSKFFEQLANGVKSASDITLVDPVKPEQREKLL
jgi:hypothetical protein